MGDALSKIFAMILIIVLFFLFPLLDSFERMDNLSYMTVYSATVKFVDEVKRTGCITREMYDELEKTLIATGNKYKIEMVHRRARYSDFGAEINAETGEILKYSKVYDEIYREGITGLSGFELYNGMEIGDYFYVSVKNVNSTPATIIKNMLYGKKSNKYSVVFSYGGMITNINTDTDTQ